MTKFYGKGSSKRIPSTYNQEQILETNKERAFGRLTAEGFLILGNSLVRKLVTLKSNPGVNEIIKQLIEEEILVDYNSEYYKLKQDILVASSSTAGRLVCGNDVNGMTVWKHNGISLKTLLLKKAN